MVRLCRFMVTPVDRSFQGLFVGLMTLDLVYQTERLPSANEKRVASDYTVAAGGPATNAAVTFCHLGHRASVLGVLGSHPLTHLICTDLETCGVAISDLAPGRTEPPPVSSILVTETTGERAVISINAINAQATTEQIPDAILSGIDIVLLDGHQMQIGWAIAQQARHHQIPVVVDGGSWKPGFETVLSLADYAICSANFHPPKCQTDTEVMAYLASLGIPHLVITHGEQPIHYQTHGQEGWLEVPSVPVVDTLGAGDIFHGAFCSSILQTNFLAALTQAAQVAALSCQSFGTRRWMQAN